MYAIVLLFLDAIGELIALLKLVLFYTIVFEGLADLCTRLGVLRCKRESKSLIELIELRVCEHIWVFETQVHSVQCCVFHYII